MRLAELRRTLLAATLSLHACKLGSGPPAATTETRALGAAGATALALPAPPPPAERRLVFDISARYPASLLYALDRAAGVDGTDLRYRQWLFGSGAERFPDWFTAYATQRASWRTTRDDGDGPYDPYAACGHKALALQELLYCLERQLQDGDYALAWAALEKAHELLRPRWLEMAPALQRWQRELQAITSGPQGTELAQLLARSAQLPDDEQLTFEVVLVARPRSDESRASQEGAHLVVEVCDDRPAARGAHVLFHEIAHLAAHHAPGRAALERAFVQRGTAGLVAANLWSETFATAFGNGLSAQRIDPQFTPDRSFYNDEAIDALGHALYRRWRDGTVVTLDPSLAEEMSQLLDSAWPRERWRLYDVTRRVVVFSDDAEAGAILRRSLPRQSLHLLSPLPTELSLPAALPPPAPRVILATPEALAERPDVLRLLGLELASARERVATSGSSLYWTEGEGGPLMLITAATQERLRGAAATFAALRLLPASGWTALEVSPAAP